MSPFVTVIIALIAALVGSGTGGFIVAWRKDNRQRPIDEAAAEKARMQITQLIEEMANRAVRKAKEEMEDADRKAKQHMKEQDEQHTRETEELRCRIERQDVRIRTLEETLRANNITIPV